MTWHTESPEQKVKKTWSESEDTLKSFDCQTLATHPLARSEAIHNPLGTTGARLPFSVYDVRVRVHSLTNVPSPVRTRVAPGSVRSDFIWRFWDVLFNLGRLGRRYAPKTHLVCKFAGWYTTLLMECTRARRKRDEGRAVWRVVWACGSLCADPNALLSRYFNTGRILRIIRTLNFAGVDGGVTHGRRRGDAPTSAVSVLCALFDAAGGGGVAILRPGDLRPSRFSGFAITCLV